jgi:energy-coupling factor transport system permease protein
VSELLYAPLQDESGAWDLLYRLDPRSKLLFVVSLVAYLALESSTGKMLLALGGLHVLCVLSKGTRARLLSFWRTLLPLLITVVVLGSLRWRAEPALLAIGPLTFTWPSIWNAVGLAARIAGLGLGISLLLWTTEPGDMVAGLTRLRFPFVIGFSFVMALQYIASFRRLFFQILEAQQSRGLTLPRANPIRSARCYIPVIVPLIISALRSADSLALALQSRGFGASTRRTSRRVLRMRVRDWLFTIGTWCVLGGLFWV